MTATAQLQRTRATRLLQIFAVTEVVLMIEMAHRFTESIDRWRLSSAILVVALLLTPVYFLAKKQQVDKATIWLTCWLTAFLTGLMWRYQGLTDEAVFGYPCVLMFAALMGVPRLFISLLVFMLCNILLLGLVNQLGYVHHHSGKTDLHTAALLGLILVLISFGIWLLLKDLNRLVHDLQNENQRVVESQQQIRQLINHDTLTGLPNRVLARERFNQALQLATHGQLTGLMFVDLDHFKHVNDTLGHYAGDQLLQHVASHLRQALRLSDTVCRISGDEFLVIVAGCGSRQEIERLAQKILQAVHLPVQVEDNQLRPTCSIGVVIAPHDGVSFDVLSQKADLAMYRAKEPGRNAYSFYDASLADTSGQTFNLLNDLQVGLKNQQFELWYQPIVSLSDRTVVGAEALLRWNHPTQGLVMPNDFIPLAEQSGLMAELGLWVLQQACVDCQHWNLQFEAAVGVSVNISPIQFARGDLEQQVLDSLDRSELPGELLQLELTESLLLENSQRFNLGLAVLRSRGVRLAIDDFGTGYSNLAYLRDFAVHTLKIDRSFMQQLSFEPRQQMLVSTMVKLAANLEMNVVAEGIEDEQTAQLLTVMHCPLGQGYLWGRPMRLADFHQYLSTHRLLRS